MAGKIQNEDIKSESEITGAGGTVSQLPNDTKIYVTANGINKKLSQAIIDGDIGGGGGGNVLITNIYDQKTSGADGGTFTSGAWQTRDLNTQSGDTTFASVASNQITLDPGTYHISARAQAFQVNSHQLRFQNVSDSTTALTGTQAYAGSTDSSATDSFILGTITIAATKTFELQHQCSVTKASQGYGIGSGFAAGIFATVKITKIEAIPGVTAPSQVRLKVGNGFGSTNTKIRRFLTTVQNSGTDITYTDSAANGASFTVNTTGTYAITYTEEGNAGFPLFGLSLNSASLTTDLNAISTSEILTIANAGTVNNRAATATTLYLTAGDVVRMHTNNGGGNTFVDNVQVFSMVGPL